MAFGSLLVKGSRVGMHPLPPCQTRNHPLGHDGPRAPSRARPTPESLQNARKPAFQPLRVVTYPKAPQQPVMAV